MGSVGRPSGPKQAGVGTSTRPLGGSRKRHRPPALPRGGGGGIGDWKLLRLVGGHRPSKVPTNMAAAGARRQGPEPGSCTFPGRGCGNGQVAGRRSMAFAALFHKICTLVPIPPHDAGGRSSFLCPPAPEAAGSPGGKAPHSGGGCTPFTLRPPAFPSLWKLSLWGWATKSVGIL